MSVALDPGFRDYLLGIADVSERDLDKLVEELLHYWAETQEAWVRRRHRELQGQGVPNRAVYGLIASESNTRRFEGRSLSERQVRRIIYG